jgi:hypothetical protein
MDPQIRRSDSNELPECAGIRLTCRGRAIECTKWEDSMTCKLPRIVANFDLAYNREVPTISKCQLHLLYKYSVEFNCLVLISTHVRPVLQYIKDMDFWSTIQCHISSTTVHSHVADESAMRQSDNDDDDDQGRIDQNGTLILEGTLYGRTIYYTALLDQ